jgi:hypothetical protein
VVFFKLFLCYAIDISNYANAIYRKQYTPDIKKKQRRILAMLFLF